MAKSQEFTPNGFRELWAKIENRFEAERKERLIISRYDDFVKYLRTFPEIKYYLGEPKGSKEGYPIYEAHQKSLKPDEFPYFTLGNDFSNALKLYAAGFALNPNLDYYKHLAEFFTETGVLNEEKISLKDIYVEPTFTNDRFFRMNDIDLYSSQDPYIDEYLGYDNIDYNDDLYENEPFKVKVFLTPTVLKWIQDKVKFSHEYNNFLLVLGDPGQGKTSFCYRLLYELTDASINPVYFYKLRDIIDLDNFYKNPFAHIFDLLKTDGYYKKDGSTGEIEISANTFKESILILDGLDELEKINNLDKDKFCNQLAELSKKLFRPYRTIITSRKEVDTSLLEKLGITCLSFNEFDIEEQMQWIQKYNQKSSKPYFITNYELENLNRSPSTKPLMGQPILLYIVALLDVKHNDNYNRTKVYEELFDQLINRYWNNFRGNQDTHIVLGKKIQDKFQLKLLLQEVGVEMFKKDSPYLSQNEIPGSIFNQLQAKQDDSMDVLRTLLIAFYFNLKKVKSHNINYYAIEFVHKTFGEYFAALGIYNKIKAVFKQANKDSESLLKEILNIFGGRRYLTTQISKSLAEIIFNERSIDNINSREQLELAVSMSYHLPYFIEREFYFEINETNFTTPITQSLQTFYLFTSIYTRIATSPNEEIMSHYEIDTKNDISSINKNMKFYNYCKLFKIIGNEGFDIQLDYSYLVGLKLNNSYFPRANFSFSNLNEIDFSYSNLKSANFTQTKLFNSTFNYANLEEANLKGVNLESSNLMFANLTKADLEGANLIGANLEGANLAGANLTNARLSYATLSYANFMSTDLSGANLSNANFFESKNLSITQLTSTYSLQNAEGFSMGVVRKLVQLGIIDGSSKGTQLLMRNEYYDESISNDISIEDFQYGNFKSDDLIDYESGYGNDDDDDDYDDDV